MRGLSLTLLCFLIAVPAALASTSVTGDGVLELQNVSGVVSIGTPQVPAEGAVWGQMDKGTLRILDPDTTDGKIHVSGSERKPVVQQTDLGVLKTYVGRDLTFRVTGGTYRLWLSGSGIDLTAVGVGMVYLNGDANAVDPGEYAVDDGDWTPVPVFLSPRQSAKVTFGDQTLLPQPSPGLQP